MDRMRTSQDLARYITRSLAMVLSIGLVLMGFPVKVAMAQASAPGQAYVNCATVASDIDRLESLAGGMQTSINQQANLTDSANSASREAWEQADQASRRLKHDQILNTLLEATTSYFTVMKRAKLLKLKGLTTQQRRIWLESMKALEQHEGLFKSFQAGYAYGDPRLGWDAKTAADKVNSIWNTLEDSGVAAEIAKEGAGVVFGPLGKALVSLSLASLDTLVTSEVAFIEADVARTAQRNLDVMAQVQDTYNSEIYRLSSLKGAHCDPKEPGPADRILVQQPRTESPAPTPTKKTGIGTGPILLIGAGVAAVGAAAAVVGASGGFGGIMGTCSTRNCDSISGCTGSTSTSCPGGLSTRSSGGSCRNNATGQRTAWCSAGLTCNSSGYCS